MTAMPALALPMSPRALPVLAAVLLAATPVLAQHAGQQGSRAFSGPCAKGDPAYERLANATGGLVMRLRPGEMGTAAAPVMIGRTQHPVAVFFANGQLGRSGERELQFWVDGAIESLWVSVSIECNVDIALLQPGAVGVPAHDPPAGVSQVVAANLRAVTIVRPQPGPWSVRVRGGGAYSVAVSAKSALQLGRFGFVRRGGRPGHEGWFPIEGPPASVRQVARATLWGPARDPSFVFLAEDGEVLQPFTLAREAEGDDHLGAVDLPRQPFRVAVVGRDAQGHTFQRIDARLWTVQAPPAAAVSRTP